MKIAIDHLRLLHRWPGVVRRQALPVPLPVLPPELWMLIAEFMDPTELEELIGLNRVFFDIVMHNRYREVKLIASVPLILFRKIDALKYELFAVGYFVLLQVFH